jgi:cysteinyl-tRNA synthetase
MDLKFPHHECEIAQSCASSGKSPVNYWMHTNMLTLNGKKMSKSTGNTLLPSELISGDNELLDKAYDPMVVRFFMMQAHYSSMLDFTSDALSASEKGFNKLMDALAKLDNLTISPNSSFDVNSLVSKYYEAMDDDFNAPILIASLFETVRHINLIDDKKETISKEDLDFLRLEIHGFVFNVLGLKPVKENGGEKVNQLMELVLQMRQNARESKNWGLSDLIRDKLNSAGITVKDGKEGPTWT